MGPLTSKPHSGALNLAPKLAQQVSFKSSLSFRMTVTLHIPRRSGNARPSPKISRMALDWPTVTSLDSLTLSVEGKNVPLRYNPVDQIIEWSDILMYPTSSWDKGEVPDGTEDDAGDGNDGDGNDGGDIRSYRSRTMYLSVGQPGELYRQPSLKGRVEIEISDYLISGMEARLFNAVGAREKIALEDRGFEVSDQALPGDGKDRFLAAWRREGPDDMNIWLLIQPRYYETERVNRVPGGHTYKSTFESGELKVFMRGALPRDSRDLTHEMYALQRALRERFDRVRARR